MAAAIDSVQLERLRQTSQDGLDAARQAGRNSRQEVRRHVSDLTHALLQHAGVIFNGRRVPEEVHQQRRQAWEGLQEHGIKALGALALAGATYATIRLVEALHHRPQKPEPAAIAPEPAPNTDEAAPQAPAEAPYVSAEPVSYQQIMNVDFFIPSDESPWNA